MFPKLIYLISVLCFSHQSFGAGAGQDYDNPKVKPSSSANAIYALAVRCVLACGAPATTTTSRLQSTKRQDVCSAAGRAATLCIFVVFCLSKYLNLEFCYVFFCLFRLFYFHFYMRPLIFSRTLNEPRLCFSSDRLLSRGK